jgi:glycosyltransferase involved in cell wall biosynthesis
MISIITPVFNGDKFIRSCIENVIDQGCSDMEHIIVDGGSNDSTIDIIRQYVENSSHIRWISEKDRGQSDAMNKGLKLARGNIIGFLNVDDFYEPHVLPQILVIFKELPEPSLLVGNCKVLNEDSSVQGINKPANLNFFDLLIGDESITPFPVNPSAYFYHASLHEKIGVYDVEDHFAMDIDFLLRAVQVAHIKYIDKNLGNFRLIKGTKTYHDQSCGQINKRFHDLLKKHRKSLIGIQRYHYAKRLFFYYNIKAVRICISLFLSLYRNFVKGR